SAYFAGKYELAIERFDRLSEIAPDYPWGLHWLALAYAELGDYERAIDLLQRALQLSPGQTVAVGRLGLFYGLSGQPELARKMLAECDRLSAGRFVDPFLRAWSWIGLDDLTMALRLYEEAFALRSPLFTIVPVDPPSVRLAKLPGFASLFRRLHYPVTGLIE
ncbi:MAG: tetratricopeptide repeat protein, partial [Acidobacteriota bacterium]|nr:tetratricopeptide repeat protein [Acidobacteriota bacterium]